MESLKKCGGSGSRGSLGVGKIPVSHGGEQREPKVLCESVTKGKRKRLNRNRRECVKRHRWEKEGPMWETRKGTRGGGDLV